MEAPQKSHHTEIDLDERIVVPSSTIIFLNKVYQLSKCSFLIEKHHIVFSLNVPVEDKNKKEVIQKVQMKIHFKHVSKVEILPSTLYEGATCLSIIVSDFAAARFADTMKRLKNMANNKKSTTLMGSASLENRITCDIFLNWNENEKEIQKLMYYISAASYVLKFPNQSNIISVNDLRTNIICFMENDVFLRITNAANVAVSIVKGNDGPKYLVFNNHCDDHLEEEEIVLSDTDDPNVHGVKLPNGLVMKNGESQVNIEVLGQTYLFPHSRLMAIARGGWLSGDDVDFFLHYHYVNISSSNLRSKILIKPIKFFLDINAKKSVEKKDQQAMEDLKSIVTADSSLKSLKDAGKEFERPFTVIPVIYKDHWFVAVVVNAAASIQKADEEVTEKKTSILIMDSLKDSRALSIDDREGIFNVLTWYLYFAKEKLGEKSETRFNRALVQKIMVQVPQQTNAIDCGVYLIKYVESFFKHLPDPESMPTDWLEDPPAMFKDFNCHQGRKDLIDIICNHAWNSEVGNVLRKECYDVLSGKR